MGENISVAFIIASMVFFSLIGNQDGKVAAVFRVGSGIFALLVGYLVAGRSAEIDMTAVNNAAFISRPALPSMVILYLIIMTETIGTWLATSSDTKTVLTEEIVSKGVVGLGALNIFASLLVAPPDSGYSSNVAGLTISDTFSRHVMKVVEVLLVVIGFSNKLSAFISAIPSSVIGGIFLTTSGIITVAGIGMYRDIDMDMKGDYIVSLSVTVALVLNLIPEVTLKNLPVIVQCILGSSIVLAALVTIILNKILPETE